MFGGGACHCKPSEPPPPRLDDFALGDVLGRVTVGDREWTVRAGVDRSDDHNAGATFYPEALIVVNTALGGKRAARAFWHELFHVFEEEFRTTFSHDDIRRIALAMNSTLTRDVFDLVEDLRSHSSP